MGTFTRSLLWNVLTFKLALFYAFRIRQSDLGLHTQTTSIIGDLWADRETAQPSAGSHCFKMGRVLRTEERNIGGIRKPLLPQHDLVRNEFDTTLQRLHSTLWAKKTTRYTFARVFAKWCPIFIKILPLSDSLANLQKMSLLNTPHTLNA